MKLPIIDLDQLRKIAGQTRFDAGVEDSRSISIVGMKRAQNEVSARLDSFEVKLRYLGDTIEGACDCPDSDGFEFCRHCVALTLHINKQQQQQESLSKGPEKSRVLAYLLSLEHQDLAKQLLSVLEQDSALFQHYVLKASLAGPELDYAELRRQITDLTRSQTRLFSQRQVKHFFARIEMFLEALCEADYGGDGERMLKLVEYALQRCNNILDRQDDNAGHHHSSAKLLAGFYQKLLGELSGRPATLAKRFYQSWIEDRHSLLGHDVKRFLDASQREAFFELLKGQCKFNKPGATFKDQGLSAEQQRKIANRLLEDPGRLTFVQRQSLKGALATRDDDRIKLAREWHEQGEAEQAKQLLTSAMAQDPENQKYLLALIEISSEQSDAKTELYQLLPEYPLEVIPRLLPLTPDSEKAALRQHCISLLQSRNLPTEMPLLFGLLEAQDRYEAAVMLASKRSEDIPGEQAAQFLVDHGIQNERASELAQKTLAQLLEKGRHKLDQLAAELLHVWSQSCPERTLEKRLDPLRHLIRERPGMLSHYRELQQT